MTPIRITHAKKPTKQMLRKDLETLTKRKWDLDKQFYRIEDIFGDQCGTPLYDNIWWVFEEWCKELANKHGIDNEDLSWFVYELDCGKDPDTVTVTIAGVKENLKIEDADSFVKYLDTL